MRGIFAGLLIALLGVSPVAMAKDGESEGVNIKVKVLDLEGNAFQGGRLMHRLKATVVRIDTGESILLLVAPALAHARVMLALGDELTSEIGRSASPTPGLRLDQHRRAARIG